MNESKTLPSIQDDFSHNLFRLAIPLTLQFLFTSSFSMVDAIMVAGLGEKAIAAVGIAGQFEFLLGMILAGVMSGPAIFMSQYYGVRDYDQIRKMTGITVLAGLGISLLYFGMISLASTELIGLFTVDPELIDMTDSFISIVSLGYIISTVASAFAISLKSIGVVKEIMWITVSSLLLNTLLNYILIHGHFGFPEMGLEGAAIATLISKVLVLGLTLLFVYGGQRTLAVSFAELFRYERSQLKKVFHVSLPVIIHETFWSLGMTMYLVAFGYLGTSALAIVQISKVVGNFVNAGVFGFSHSASVMIGEQIGKRQPKRAQDYARRFTKIGIISATITGSLLFLAAPVVIDWFQISPDLHEQAVQVFRLMAVVLVFNFLNNIWIVGVFRSGGDTRFSMKQVLTSTWLVGIPLTFIGAVWLKWPLEIVYLLYATEEISKAVIGYFRYKSGRWQHYLLGSSS